MNPLADRARSCDFSSMPKRTSKPDLNSIAHSIVKKATDALNEPKQKNPAAVALGRSGGLKGGVARAAKLSKGELSEIGRAGAAARWKKPSES